MDAVTTTNDPALPNESMISEVREAGYAWRPDVEQALRTDPRQAFLPEAPSPRP